MIEPRTNCYIPSDSETNPNPNLKRYNMPLYLTHMNIKPKSKYDYPTKPKLSMKPDGMYLTDGKTFANKKIYSIEPNQFESEADLTKPDLTETDQTSYILIMFDKFNDIYICCSNFYDSIKKRLFNDYQPIQTEPDYYSDDEEFSL